MPLEPHVTCVRVCAAVLLQVGAPPLAVHASLALTAGFGIGSLVLLWLVVLCLASRRRRYEAFQRAIWNELERRRKLAEGARRPPHLQQVVVVINPCNSVQSG
ncbi:hypothetical protein WJX81_005737 [Elliptochloris bilobata]|uniref:Uncharacterized protein n=1 Tax=Elliptochloris bilobata TaxID=381761 RepID=A0AAW1QXU3_9CHLO